MSPDSNPWRRISGKQRNIPTATVPSSQSSSSHLPSRLSSKTRPKLGESPSIGNLTYLRVHHLCHPSPCLLRVFLTKLRPLTVSTSFNRVLSSTGWLPLPPRCSPHLNQQSRKVPGATRRKRRSPTRHRLIIPTSQGSLYHVFENSLQLFKKLGLSPAVRSSTHCSLSSR